MKHLIICLSFLLVGFLSFAQDKEDEEKKGGFKKENLFTGGTVDVSFGNQYTSLGVGPFFGYSINKYLDVAASVNFNYSSQRDNYISDDRIRQTDFGPGAFIRVFPVKFIFAQVQYEHNFLKLRYKYPSSYNLPDETTNADVNSVLVGGGYAGGRDKYNKSFFYISVLWDVSRVQGSPYTDNLNRSVPIIRAGYNIALFQKN